MDTAYKNPFFGAITFPEGEAIRDLRTEKFLPEDRSRDPGNRSRRLGGAPGFEKRNTQDVGRPGTGWLQLNKKYIR